MSPRRSALRIPTKSRPPHRRRSQLPICRDVWRNPQADRADLRVLQWVSFGTKDWADEIRPLRVQRSVPECARESRRSPLSKGRNPADAPASASRPGHVPGPPTASTATAGSEKQRVGTTPAWVGDPGVTCLFSRSGVSPRCRAGSPTRGLCALGSGPEAGRGCVPDAKRPRHVDSTGTTSQRHRHPWRGCTLARARRTPANQPDIVRSRQRFAGPRSSGRRSACQRAMCPSRYSTCAWPARRSHTAAHCARGPWPQ